MATSLTGPWGDDGVKEGDLLYIHPRTRWERFSHRLMRSFFRRKNYGIHVVDHVTSATSLTVRAKDSPMKRIHTVFSIFTLIITCLVFAVFVTTVGEATGAPQEAALAAMTLAVIVPMYVIARCIEMLQKK